MTAAIVEALRTRLTMGRTGRALRIVDRQPMNAAVSLTVVRFGDEQLLLSVGKDAATLIARRFAGDGE